MVNNLGQRTGLCVGGCADGEFHVSRQDHHLCVVKHHMDPAAHLLPIGPAEVAEETPVSIKRVESHYKKEVFVMQDGEFHLWVHEGMTLASAFTKILNTYAVHKKREEEERHGR